MVKGRTFRSNRFKRMSKQPQRTQRQRRFRGMRRNSNFKSYPLTTKITIHSEKISSDGFLSKTFAVKDFTQVFKSSFSEFRFHRISVKFIPSRSAGTDQSKSQYAITLLDGDSTDQTVKWSDGWFKSIANTPGSLIKRDTEASTRVWYPTEPLDRDWFQSDSAHGLLTLFMIRSIWEDQDEAKIRMFRGTLTFTISLSARISALKTTFASVAQRRLLYDEQDMDFDLCLESPNTDD